MSVTVRAGEVSRTSGPVTVRVKDAAPPTVQFPLAQSTVPFGTKLPLNATARGSECGGTPTLRYSASEGSVSGNTFDSSTVAFALSNRLKQQTKILGDLRAALRQVREVPLDLVHYTADGPIHLLVQQDEVGQWRATFAGQQLQGSRPSATIAEANEFLAASFHLMFPEHECDERCRPAGRRR